MLQTFRFQGSTFDENGRYNNLDHLQASYHIREPDANGHTFTALGWSTARTNDQSSQLAYVTPDQFTYNPDTDRFELSLYLIWVKNTELIYLYRQDNSDIDNDATVARSVTYGNPTIENVSISGVRAVGRTSGGERYQNFISWNTAYDGSGTTYENGDTVSLTEDLTLYAQYDRRFHLKYCGTNPEDGGSTTNLPDEEHFTVRVNTMAEDDAHELSLQVPELVTADGHKRYFIGWSLTLDGSQLLEDDQIPLSDLHKSRYYIGLNEYYYSANIYAVWSTAPYQITFNPNYVDNSLVTDMPEDENELPYSSVRKGYRLPATKPKAPGGTFENWWVYYTDRNGDEHHVNRAAGGMVDRKYFRSDTQKVEARAIWTKWYALVYDSNNDGDGLVTAAPDDVTFYILNSSSATDYQIPSRSASRTGYTIRGWAETPDSTQNIVGTRTPLSSFALNIPNDRFEKTVYAIWDRNYTLIYDKNAGSDTVSGMPTLSNAFTRSTGTASEALSEKIPRRTGYTFKGWALSPDSTETLANNEIPLNTDVFTLSSDRFTATVYAVWENNLRYTVTYRPGEGSGTDVSDEFAPGAAATVKAGSLFLPPVGKEFDGWQCDTEGYSTTPGDTITVENNIVYTATWKNVYYTLRYDKGEVSAATGLPAGRTDITWADIRAGVNISEETPQADGYTFTGWRIVNADDSSVSKDYDAAKFGSMTAAEQRVDEALFDGTRTAVAVAQWSADSTAHFTVTYRVTDIPAGFDYPAEQTDSYPEGTEIPLKPVPSGYDTNRYEFIGWESDDIDAAQSSFTLTGNVVIRGAFQEKGVPPQPETFTVTYKDSENASALYTDTEISGEYTLLGVADTGFTAPDGKTFDGWKLLTPSDKGYPAEAQAGGSITVVSDVTYEAQWKDSVTPPVNQTATIHYTSGLTEDYPGWNESCAAPFVIQDVPATAEYAVLGNDPQSDSNPSFAPDGYTFAGWKLVSGTGGSSPRPTALSGGAGSDGLYHEGDTVATDALASGSVTLRAVWQVSLQYDANGGTGELPADGAPIPQYVDSSVTAADGGSLQDGDKGFDHWNTKADDSGTKVQPGQNLTMKDNTVLYAVYTDSPNPPDDTHYKVTYDANGGTGDVPADNHQYQSGDTVNVASKGSLARTGASFKEWNTKPDGSGTGYQGDGSDSFVITADTTLYAIWVDDSGKVIPSPGTGESSIPMVIALNTVVLSLAALAWMAVRARRRRAEQA